METPCQPVVFTNDARCRDCYRCLRGCPVKAIALENGQAHVIDDRCIACGNCIKNCPQHAKQYRHDLATARHIVAHNEEVAVSIAPSFAGLFSTKERMRLPDALRKLGFTKVEETSVAAKQVAKETFRLFVNRPNKPLICSACPVVVDYISCYQPDKSSLLAPIVSPMQAHARMVKQAHPEMKFVFIGPCIAKIKEAETTADNQVDCVITFDDLNAWLKIENISLPNCDPGGFDSVPQKYARLFPIVGGLIQTAGIADDLPQERILSISGIDEVKTFIDDISEESGSLLVEPLFCNQGCINGPGYTAKTPVFERKKTLIEYGNNTCNIDSHSDEAVALGRMFDMPPIEKEEITQEQIDIFLRETGKGDVENRLNCGACGYDTCEAKAVAVLCGRAEKEMCLPQMRRLAEQRSDLIINTVPSGIVILDAQLKILHMNPSFQSMFLCTQNVAGKPVSYLIDPYPFETLAAKEAKLINEMTRYENYALTVQLLAYPLETANQYVGIFVNLTQSLLTEQKLKKVKTETMHRARAIMAHQIKMAQEIAKYLGDSAAEGEMLVNNLMRLGFDDDDDDDEVDEKKKDKEWSWDIFTSK